jgi:hypothetical protein
MMWTTIGKIMALAGLSLLGEANFTDRRYIHPSVFDGSSRRYVRR